MNSADQTAASSLFSERAVAEDRLRLYECHALLAIALAAENHQRIAQLDDEIHFYLRLEMLRAAQTALNGGDVADARQFLDWAANGVPRSFQREFLDRIVSSFQ